jgi:hypothetical protein
MKKWLLAISAVVLLATVAAFYYARNLTAQWEPMAREQLIAYLEKRFDSSVEVGHLDIKVPVASPWKLITQGVDGNIIEASGENFKLRYKHRTDIPPMIEFSRISLKADLRILYKGPRVIQLVKLDGLKVVMPPKGQRPKAEPSAPNQGEEPKQGNDPIIIEKIVADGAVLKILPSKPGKEPLEFDLYKLTLTSQGPGKPLRYETTMTNPKPPGLIYANGEFGPWKTAAPRESALNGNYKFSDADLGIFKGIAGILQSTGKFEGVVENIHAEGECRVPDFRLEMSGNRVPLRVNYNARIDGTDGDTYLRPVNAVLGKTAFTARGYVVGLKGFSGRSIHLDVDMPSGELADVLRLAMKQDQPFLEGKIAIKTRLDIPPGPVSVIQKIKLDGRFQIREANFTSSAIQDKIDGLSKRGQGKPKDQSIDNVPATFNGTFRMADGRIAFNPVIFVVPGALVDLTGNYAVTEGGELDFRGSLNLEAKVSDTFSGWKRWALKPFNPVFSKNDAGTFFRIAITGDAKNPKFGLDKGK